MPAGEVVDVVKADSLAISVGGSASGEWSRRAASPQGDGRRHREPQQPLDEEEAEPAEAAAGREQLEWYKNVSQTGRPEAKLSQSEEPVKTASPTSKRQVDGASTKGSNSENSSTAVYKVQVGAFRQERQAEVLAGALEAKGYSCEIEPPIPENELYRVKVGSFNSRAEAVATQLRLKKDGYSSFITTK